MYKKFLVFVLLAAVQTGFAKLPSTIKPCYRNSPDLEKCIVRAVYKLRPMLANGDLGDGFLTPPLEPLLLDNIEMGRGTQFHAVFSDIEARGGSNFSIDKLKANASAIAYDIALTLPRIQFVGKYLMKLNILLIDIQGQGNMKGQIDNAKAIVKMRGSRYLKDGIEYVKMDKMPMRISVAHFKLHLDNLFNGDKTLGEVGNKIINENQELYLNEIIPGMEKSLSKKFLEVANQILATATFDEMFPPNASDEDQY